MKRKSEEENNENMAALWRQLRKKAKCLNGNNGETRKWRESCRNNEENRKRRNSEIRL